MKPALKFVGGKTQLLDEILARLPERIEGRYVEPMVGGGALFFELASRQTSSVPFCRAFVLNDTNHDLMNFYAQLKLWNPDFQESLKKHSKRHGEAYFYAVRDGYKLLTDPVERASTFYYINRAGFNGLWRENSEGRCNTSWGKHKQMRVNVVRLDACCAALQTAELRFTDYKEVLDDVKPGDFVYLDPPYLRRGGFTSYTRKRFDLAAHIELAYRLADLDRQGVKWLLSGADGLVYRDLFSRYNIETVSAKRNVACVTESRARVQELLISNYTPEGLTRT